MTNEPSAPRPVPEPAALCECGDPRDQHFEYELACLQCDPCLRYVPAPPAEPPLCRSCEHEPHATEQCVYVFKAGTEYHGIAIIENTKCGCWANSAPPAEPVEDK